MHLKDITEFNKTEVKDLLKNASVSRKKNHIDIVLGDLQGSNYNKNPKASIFFPLTKIAVDRAKNMDNPSDAYPVSLGSHVYKLMEKLLK